MPLTAVIALLAAATPPSGPDCQAAMRDVYREQEEAALPGLVEGASLAGRDALVALRFARGDALIAVKGGDFSEADFRGARVHNICFLGTRLVGADWRDAEASGIGFVRTDLTGAKLNGARMPHILLRASTLRDVDASNADFSGGKVDGGWSGSLVNLRLEGANLSGFRFECGITLDDGCPVDREINFRGANLSRASLHSYWGVSDWTGVRIDRTEVSLAQLLELDGADMAGPLLVRGGEAIAELTPTDYAALRPHIRRTDDATGPSFDCTRAAKAAEREICGDYAGSLRAQDVVVSNLYRRARAADPTVAASQRAWLQERDQCDAAALSCLSDTYARRKGELIARLGVPEWAKAGTTALFVEPDIAFDEAFHASPLYHRLLPVIVGSASGKVAVRVNADGTIDAAGEAIGANAHLCSLSGVGLRFDPATGWFSGPFMPSGDDPKAWGALPMPVLRFWEGRAEVYLGGRGGATNDPVDPRPSDYASCGARASFGEMVRVPLTDAEVARIQGELRRAREP